MFKVGECTVEKILQSFDKNKEGIDEDIVNLQKWMDDQPHLPETLDKRSTMNFLILNKFSIEKTKQKIDTYYTVRTKLDDVYQHINPKLPHMTEFRNIIYFVPHPQLLDFRRVFFCKIRNADLAEKLDPCNMLRCMVNVHEMRMREDVMYGEIFVVDCYNVPLSYYLKLNPTIIFKCMAVIYGVLLHAC
ncbi:retinol-binding protein pinta-like [Zophobas morio]|uniref:retinol-binding protein pinta-like n=1 Tax=Zophobas morio TaxID=2755281 RepID=UPI003083C46C